MVRMLVVFVVVVGLAGAGAASAQSIEGVWTLGEVEVTSGPDEGHITRQPGVAIFLDGYYSVAAVTSVQPRPHLGDSPTQEELALVYGPYVSNAGTYEIDGTRLIARPQVAKDPAMMEPGYTLTWQIRELTEDRFEVTGTPVPGGDSVRVVYARVVE